MEAMGSVRKSKGQCGSSGQCGGKVVSVEVNESVWRSRGQCGVQGFRVEVKGSV